MKRISMYVVACGLLSSGMLTFGMDKQNAGQNSPTNLKDSGEYHFGDITKKVIAEGKELAKDYEFGDITKKLLSEGKEIIEDIKELHETVRPVVVEIADKITDNKDVIAAALIMAGKKSEDAHNITDEIVNRVEQGKDISDKIDDLATRLEAANIAKK